MSALEGRKKGIALAIAADPRSRVSVATGTARVDSNALVQSVVPRGRARRARRDFLVDATMLGLAFATAVASAHTSAKVSDGGLWLAALPALTLALLAVRGTYRPRVGVSFLEELRTVVFASAAAAITVGFAQLCTGADSRSASTAVVVELALVIAFLIAGRAAIGLLSRTGAGAPTLIVGADQVGCLLARRLVERPRLGLRPVGFIDANPLAAGQIHGCPVLGPPSQLESLARSRGVEHAILSFSPASPSEEHDMLRRLGRLGVSVSVVPRLFDDMPDRISVARVGGLPLLSIYPSSPSDWRFKIKYAVERALTVAGTLITAPVMLAIAIAIVGTMGRPVLFRQRRVGLDGREFEMLKFRSMVRGAERDQAKLQRYNESDGPVFKIREDPRVTPVGRFIRRTSLDELPQIINVLKGDMTLIGPRPPLPSEVAMYNGEQRRRLTIKPGITGLWQVAGRSDIDFDELVELDVYYIHNRSLWMDLTILLRTAGVVLSGRGAY